MSKLKLFLPLLVLGCGVVAWTQEKAPPEEKMMSEAPMTGKQLFQVYCAACHGPQGKGNGPVAPALKEAVPDLTLLSKKSGGKFPLLRVEQIIDGEEGILAHGTRDMPIYGELFENIRRDRAFVTQRIDLLTGYIESLQSK